MIRTATVAAIAMLGAALVSGPASADAAIVCAPLQAGEPNRMGNTAAAIKRHAQVIDDRYLREREIERKMRSVTGRDYSCVEIDA